jgi:hypothetical protein
VVTLRRVVGVLLGVVPHGGKQVVEHDGEVVALSLMNLCRRDLRAVDGLLEEAPDCCRVTAWGDKYVDDLPELAIAR